VSGCKGGRAKWRESWRVCSKRVKEDLTTCRKGWMVCAIKDCFLFGKKDWSKAKNRLQGLGKELGIFCRGQIEMGEAWGGSVLAKEEKESSG